MRLAPALVLALIGLGCGGPATLAAPDAGRADAEAPGDAAAPGSATYYEDVRPLLSRHCVRCHSGTGIAPFALETYADAAPLAARIADATRARIMPPFLADGSGACQTFETGDWLTEAELQTLEAWRDDGALEGDPTTPPPMVPPPTHLSGADVTTLDTGIDYAPSATSANDYHCFVVDGPTGYVTAYEVEPSNPRITHHVIVYAPSDAAAAADVRALDAAEPGPGYTCFGGAGASALSVGGWAPGAGPEELPGGTGIAIDASRPLVVQVHYNTANGDGTDRTRVRLRMAASAIPAFFLPVADLLFSAPPHEASASSTFTQGNRWLEAYGLSTMRVWGAFPHMHTLGASQRTELVRADGTTECLIDVPRWDFNWQRQYWYPSPLTMTTLDSLRIACSWNTMSRDTAVTWGERTEDEMCLDTLYVSL